MERNFSEVLSKIKEVAPEDLVKEIDKESGFWAPEVRWYELSRIVNNLVVPSSANEQSVKVYAILCDLSEEEMKNKFIADGR